MFGNSTFESGRLSRQCEKFLGIFLEYKPEQDKICSPFEAQKEQKIVRFKVPKRLERKPSGPKWTLCFQSDQKYKKP